MTAGALGPNVPTAGAVEFVPPLLHQATGAWAARTLRPDGRGMIDLTGNGRDAIFGGNDAAPTTNDPQALPYDGTRYVHVPGTDGNYAEVAYAEELHTTGTVEGYIRARTDWQTQAAGTRYTIGHASAGGTSAGVRFGLNAGSASVVWSDGVSGASIVHPITPPDGALIWLHCTFTPGDGASVPATLTARWSAQDVNTWQQVTEWTDDGTFTSASTKALAKGTSKLVIGGSTTLCMLADLYAAAWILDGTTVLDVDFTLRDARPLPVSDLLASATGAWRAADVSPSSLRLTDLTGNGHHALFGGNGNQATTNDPLYLPYDGEQYLYLPGTTADRASVPDEAALDLVGDLDLEVEVALDTYANGTWQTLISKHPSNGISGYDLRIAASGALYLLWGDGAAQQIQASSGGTLGALVGDGNRCTLRATLDVDNGDGSHVVRFYVDGVQLGTDTLRAGATTVATNTYGVTLSNRTQDGSQAAAGKFYGATIKDGIDGTTVLDIDFTSSDQFPDGGATTTGTAATGQTVTIARATLGRKSVMVERPVLLLGTDDYLEAPDLGPVLARASTLHVVAVYAKTYQAADTVQVVAGQRELVGTGYPGWYLGPRDNLDAYYAQYGTVAQAAVLTSPNRSDNSHRRTTQALYVGDGVLGEVYASANGVAGTAVAPALTTSTINSAQPFRMGRTGGNASTFHGELFGVAVFVDQHLTDAQIDAVATELAAPAASPPAPDGWDPSRRDLVSGGQFVRINRATAGRMATVVERPTLLLGTDDYAAVPHDDAFNIGTTDDVTVVAAFRLWDLPLVAYGLLSKRASVNSSATNVGWSLHYNVADQLITRVADGTTQGASTLNTRAHDGAIDVAGFTLDRTAGELVTFDPDGTAVPGTPPAVAPAGNTHDLVLGRAGAGYNIDGELFGVAVFIGRTLTPAEIAQVATELAPNRG